MSSINFRLAGLVGLILLVFALSACQTTSTRVIQQGFQSQDDRVKFLYVESPGNTRGILECSVADDGELHDCRDINLVFNEDN